MDGKETLFEPQVIDSNGDGIADCVVTNEDLNGDGIVDTTTIISDSDVNGMADSIVMLIDTDNSGAPDTLVGAEVIDTNGDEIGDTVVVYENRGIDDTIENIETYNGNETAFSEAFLNTGYENEYKQFNPENTDMDNVIGDPVGDESVWEYQGDSGPCAIYAQAMAYQNVTGEEVDVNELIETATEEGWYDGDGTAMDDMDKVLNYLGIDADVEYRGDMDDIRECLENGGRVVAAVDGNEIWLGDNDTCYSPNDPNHAIEVIGIDYSGDEPMVIINDSGTPDGHAIMVPKEQFVDAWEDSDFAYVCVYPQTA